MAQQVVTSAVTAQSGSTFGLPARYQVPARYQLAQTCYHTAYDNGQEALEQDDQAFVKPPCMSGSGDLLLLQGWRLPPR